MKYAFNLLQIIILGTIKLSVIFFYRRLFRGRAFDHYSKGMMAVVGFWATAFFLGVLFECGTRFEDLWSTLLNLISHCADEEIFFKAFAISDVIIDGLILAMPCPIVCPISLRSIWQPFNVLISPDLATTDVIRSQTGFVRGIFTGRSVSLIGLNSAR